MPTAAAFSSYGVSATSRRRRAGTTPIGSSNPPTKQVFFLPASTTVADAETEGLSRALRKDTKGTVV